MKIIKYIMDESHARIMKDLSKNSSTYLMKQSLILCK